MKPFLVRSVATSLTLAAMHLVAAVPARAGGTVTNCSEANLRAAMAGGGLVTFACDGTITLAGTISPSVNTVLDATGREITISGNGAVRVFSIGANVTLTLSNLTLANGYVAGPFATSAPSPGYPPVAGQGGGIFNMGNLVLWHCVFTNNQAVGGGVLLGYGGSGQGGAIYNTGSNVIANCVFCENSATGGAGAPPNYGYSAGGGGDAEGGAVYNSGSLTLICSSLTNNFAVGITGAAAQPMPTGMSGAITGGSGGAARGGAIYNSGSLLMQNSTVAMNAASAGSGGGGGTGGADYDQMDSGNLGDSGGTGGPGGSASGAIYNAGAASLVNDTVALNAASGGGGGPGGTGGQTTVRFPDWAGGAGGTGGAGGSGGGGICDASGDLWMTNCTVAANHGFGGSGGGGGSGGLGTAPDYPLGPAGSVGGSGSAVGGVETVGCVVANTLLASNPPSNWSATDIDAGHNLSSDASCAFQGAGSRTNVNPLLGPLANNGGPTPTMALLPGSPAIDAGAAAGAPATDQRGVARPQGPGVDIGAYEFQYIPFFYGSARRNATNCQMLLAGLLPNQSFTVQVSSNLAAWSTVTNGLFGTNGVFQFVDPIQTNCRSRFYRFGTP